MRLIAAGVGEMVERMRPSRWSSVEKIIAHLTSNVNKLESILKERDDGEWSALMFRSEIARRVTERRKARWRDVEKLLSQYDMTKVGRKWRIRIDHMDPEMRQRLKEPQ